MTQAEFPAEWLEQLDARWQQELRPTLLHRFGIEEHEGAAAALDRLYQAMRREYPESWQIHQEGAAFRYGSLEADLFNIGQRLNSAFEAQKKAYAAELDVHVNDAHSKLGQVIGAVTRAFGDITGYRPIFPKVGLATQPGVSMFDPRLSSTRFRE
ncbi:MAG: hypothetical protein J0L97_08990 [Alphaproteobacteria bacterium]|nr:hypothetical protein [Alphaproteobacteria bacterium]